VDLVTYTPAGQETAWARADDIVLAGRAG
jgi:hypothetical protein